MRIITVSKTAKIGEPDNWLWGIDLYMQALKKAGLEAPEFNYREEIVDIDRKEPQRSMVKVTIQMMVD